MSSGEREGLPMYQRALAAAGASIISSFVVNPLDVAKTRMQETPLVAGVRSPSTLKTLRTIAAEDGALALWRGTGVALTIAVPTVGMYFPLYDSILAHCRGELGLAGDAAPLVAGTAARCVTTVVATPIEILRVRILSGHAEQYKQMDRQEREGGAAGTAARAPARAAPAAFRGLGATLARDLPFTFIYWGIVERIRGALMPEGSWNEEHHAEPGAGPIGAFAERGLGTAGTAPSREIKVLGANALAGFVGGAVAGALTTPMDVVKTRTQLSSPHDRQTTLAAMRDIARSEGAAGLFSGAGARALKAAPACAIVLGSYEVIKMVYEKEAAAAAP